MIVLIDNYDSFVHNLARYFRRLGHATVVVRNDAVSPGEVIEQRPEAIVLSPGPCTPAQAGCSLALVGEADGTIPILGVCLGHQVIGEAFGGKVVRAKRPVHGQSSRIHHDGLGLFEGLPDPLIVGRYHSLVVDEQTLPKEVEVTARTNNGIVMALAHCEFPIYGVQFHPESILTEGGYAILANFLRLAGISHGVTRPLIEDERPLIPEAAPVPIGPVTF